MKPILFNTEMVQAILEGRKTVTRRTIKPQPIVMVDGKIDGRKPQIIYTSWENFINHKTPYQVGEVLYVRETWQDISDNEGNYIYKANSNNGLVDIGFVNIPIENIKWRPSIHMPKAAARIFLKVIDVRCERLQNIDIKGIKNEGVKAESTWDYVDYLEKFEELWNSTVKI